MESRHDLNPTKDKLDLENPPDPNMGRMVNEPSPHQELTLSYMCDKDKDIGFLPKPFLHRSADPSPDQQNGDRGRWIERDFLRLGTGPNKRDTCQLEEQQDEENPYAALHKKARADRSVNLSLAPIPPARRRSTAHSAANSEDHSVSFSHSFSHPFSHNPSCSLTINNSQSRDTDNIWYAGAGEGTNGSVHSKFRPVGGDNINFSSHAVGNGGCPRKPGDDSNCASFPSLLPPRSAADPGKARLDCRRGTATVKPELVLCEIVAESVPVVARMLKELPDGAVEATKNYVRGLIAEAGSREELVKMQRRLERRSDLTPEALLKCSESQLDILVAVKTGIDDFLSRKTRRPSHELAEIFLLARCPNAACNSVLPVEDCECKICSRADGFCSACMCPVCMKFDCAERTCTWVGCDVCSHWCHAFCGLEKNLIRPGTSLKGPEGTTEVLFYCLGCGHASEMFGFAKDVFVCCAKDWGLETLKRELDCIMKIFRVSDDAKGRQLHDLTETVLALLHKELISPGAACDAMLQFLEYGKSELSPPNDPFKDVSAAASAAHTSTPSKPSNTNSSSLAYTRKMPLTVEPPSTSWKPCDTAPLSSVPKMEGFDSIETMVQFKLAEVALFQSLADKAQREVAKYSQMIQLETHKLEEEYASKLAVLCLKETQERRTTKLEELKLLEDSHRDYYKMKMRMEAEVANLLQRMEMTKQQLVPL